MSDTWIRILRTLAQLVAGGVLFELTEQIAGDVPASYAPYVIIGYAVLVAAVQNVGEELGWWPSSRGGGEPVVD